MDRLLLKIRFRNLPVLVNRAVVLTCLFFTPTYSLAEQLATIISSNSNHYHQSLIQNIQNNLERTNIKIRNIDINQQETIDKNGDIIISIGSKAAKFLDQNNLSNTQLRVLTKTTPYKGTPKNNKLQLSMTHSLCQQFALIRLLNADWKTVSIMLAKQNALETKKLETCAAQYNFTLQTILISQYVNMIDALNSSLLNSDALLALPDPSVYNAKTVKSILLTTYRHRVPVIGFSEAFVHAGALAAIHSSTDQLGKQISELIQNYFKRDKINKHYIYPKYFDVAINKDVAKSLGITTPDRKVLIEKLKSHNHD